MKSTSEPLPARSKPRRRWPRFSLRTLLVVVTALGVWLGVQVNRANKQRRAVAWVQQVGGTVTYDDGSYAPEWLREHVGVDVFDDVRGVDLNGTQVKDVTQLSELTSLKGLYLRGPQVSDVTPLAALTSLEVLDLNGTQVRDVTSLAALTSLTELHLNVTQVSDVTPLAALTSLQLLQLSGTQVKDVTPLAGLTSLQMLYLGGTQVSEAAVEQLQKTLSQLLIDRKAP